MFEGCREVLKWLPTLYTDSMGGGRGELIVLEGGSLGGVWIHLHNVAKLRNTEK